MPTALSNGINIEYESIGDTAAPAILLIMGVGMQLISWPEPFCLDLASKGFRVIRFDNRDCGLSTRFPAKGKPRLALTAIKVRLGLPVRAPYYLSDMAADTIGLMDFLGIDKAHLVGASMGGMIAQAVAAKYPARVTSLTSIMSTTGNPRVSRGKPDAMKALLSRPKESADLNVTVDHMVRIFGIIGSPGYRPSEAELRGRIEFSVKRGYYPAGTTRQILAIIASGDRRASLAKITAPTLVIHGVEDPLVPLAAGRDTAANIRGAKMLEIPGMAHDLPGPLLPDLAKAIAEHCSEAEAVRRNER